MSDKIIIEPIISTNESPNDAKNMRDLGGKKVKISGLCCANCARELEEILNKIQGVNAIVDFMNMQVILNCEGTLEYQKAIYEITHFEDVKIVDGAQEKVNLLKLHLYDTICILISALFFIPAIIFTILNLEGAFVIFTYVFYGIAYFAVGHKVLSATAKNLAKGKVFDENFLMTVASLGAVVLGVFTGDGLFEGVAVMLLYQIGELLQGVAVGASKRSITELMNLKSDVATLCVGEKLLTVDPEELKISDIILVKSGEKIPVDGEIYQGETVLDTKSLNGEALPMEVCEGAEVLSGAINVGKAVKIKVIREYKNSAVSKILEMVENSTAKKAKPEKFISKFAKYYTPAVCVAAILVASIIPTVICAVQSAFVWSTYQNWIYKALSFLVISCPCALVISVPLSYFCGIGKCAKSGILVKGSTCLDELSSANIIAFDKTGTLTEGLFTIVEYSSERALYLAASAEKFSSHPIAKAFENVAVKYAVENVLDLSGKGVKCTLDEKILLCGNSKLLEENGVKFNKKNSISTLVYVALGGEYVGFIAIDDQIKENAKENISTLKNLGISKAYMLTGDKNERAQFVAQKVGLDDYEAELLPHEKLQKAKELQQKGKLIYVGDGINDAPVMTTADCAVSMGKVGSDAAIEASDIVLVFDNLSLIPKARKVAKNTKNIVLQNIIGSLVIKFAIMALSVFVPSFPLIIAIFGDVGVMLLAVLNSLRINF